VALDVVLYPHDDDTNGDWAAEQYLEPFLVRLRNGYDHIEADRYWSDDTFPDCTIGESQNQNVYNFDFWLYNAFIYAPTLSALVAGHPARFTAGSDSCRRKKELSPIVWTRSYAGCGGAASLTQSWIAQVQNCTNRLSGRVKKSARRTIKTALNPKFSHGFPGFSRRPSLIPTSGLESMPPKEFPRSW
jgi:hypothetical protein